MGDDRRLVGIRLDKIDLSPTGIRRQSTATRDLFAEHDGEIVASEPRVQGCRISERPAKPPGW